MKKTPSPTNAEIPLVAQRPIQRITDLGFIIGAILSAITLLLFMLGLVQSYTTGLPVYWLFFFAFSFFCAIPVGLAVGLIVIFRTEWLRHQFGVTSLRKSYPGNKIGIILCLFPTILMAAFFLIAIIGGF